MQVFTVRECEQHSAFLVFPQGLVATSGLASTYLHFSSWQNKIAGWMTARSLFESTGNCLTVLWQVTSFVGCFFFFYVFVSLLGGHFGMVKLFGEGRECLWSDSPVATPPQPETFSPDKLCFLPKTGSQSNNDQLRDITCLRTDYSLTGQFCESTGP